MPANLPSTVLPDLHPVVPADVRTDFKTEDDTPVDNVYSEKQQRLLTEPLYSSWRGPDGTGKFVAMANAGLFYTDAKPAIVPDALFSVGVEVPDDMWQREHRSYFLSEYGKNPDVVIEVVSNKAGEELGEKLRTYAEAKVPHYVVWDPNDQLRQGRLTAFRLQGENYDRQPQVWFEEVGLGLTVWHGIFEGKDADWLRWCDKRGAVIPTGQQRAEQEKQRADRLAAQLRALGIEPKEQ
jgi:Uma2 family endonuclease